MTRKPLAPPLTNWLVVLIAIAWIAVLIAILAQCAAPTSENMSEVKWLACLGWLRVLARAGAER